MKLINGKYIGINILLTPELKKLFEHEAKKRGVSVSSFLKMAGYEKATEKK